MKIIFFFFVFLYSQILFAQKPMIGYTPSEIKQRNYLEFSTKLDSWIIHDNSLGNETILSNTFTINGVFDAARVSYYFKNNTEFNYQCIIFTYSKVQFLDFKQSVIEKSTYAHDGWYKTNSTGMFVKFIDNFYDKDGKLLYCIGYKGEID